MVFTHGDGFVAAPANTVANGYPDYTVSDLLRARAHIPVDPAAHLLRPVGHRLRDRRRRQRGVAARVRHRQPRYTYTGAGGVPVGNLFQRAVFATEYGERNFLFSSEINANSKIMYNRDPRPGCRRRRRS